MRDNRRPGRIPGARWTEEELRTLRARYAEARAARLGHKATIKHIALHLRSRTTDGIYAKVFALGLTGPEEAPAPPPSAPLSCPLRSAAFEQDEPIGAVYNRFNPLRNRA